MSIRIDMLSQHNKIRSALQSGVNNPADLDKVHSRLDKLGRRAGHQLFEAATTVWPALATVFMYPHKSLTTAPIGPRCFDEEATTLSWDDGKHESSFAKHCIAFEYAEAFEFETALVATDVTTARCAKSHPD